MANNKDFIVKNAVEVGGATKVTVGVAAAIGTRHASNRWPWMGAVARRAPYLSSLLIIGVGVYVGWHGWAGLNA